MAENGTTTGSAKSVVVIPARGGSKRIPLKNIRQFHGQPMMAWPIERARQSGIFDRIVVSTDDPQMADVARASGAEVPFMRDPKLADDLTGTGDVVRDAIQRLEIEDDTIVCCLYATAAFVTSDDLKEAQNRLRGSSLPWIFTAGEYRTPIQRAYHQTEHGMQPLYPENMPKRSQDLEPCYFDAGQAYMARAGTWRAPTGHVWDGAEALVLPDQRCVDIDTEDDWQRAERLFGLVFDGDING